MGFGFVVARFGLFLQEHPSAQGVSPPPGHGLSLWFGVAFVGVSVMVNLLTGWHHIHLVRAMNPSHEGRQHSTTLALSIALFLALVGLAMGIYLLSADGSAYLQSNNSREISMTGAKDNGIVDRISTHSVEQTVEKLQNILQSKGVTLFALVDHSGEAQKVGMKMRPTKLLIFGNPKVGTPLMLAAPKSAIDLPLKILVWEDDDERVWISYNSAQYLQDRYRLPQELVRNIDVVETLAAKAGE
jgi:uncharacterized protein (DUF302 family)